MTLEELQAQMATLGFRWWPCADTAEAVIGTFYRPIETRRPCTTNHRDQLAARVHDYGTFMPERCWPPGGRYVISAEILGGFEPAWAPGTEDWAKVEIHGLAPVYFLAHHAEIAAALVRAWEALA